jgi:hypothetical protein
VPRPSLLKSLPLAGLGLALLAGGLGIPAMAQDSGERVNQLIVFGDDPCPPSVGDEITVCARKDEAERYRIPAPLRATPSSQNEAWNNRVLAYETVGRSGAESCSPSGAGGWTGCASQLISKAYAEKQSDPALRFGELIAAEREKRLSTLDAEAAETQARVEQAEREFEARQRAQQGTSGQN